MRAHVLDGFDPQPQDLVMTLLGAYVVPHDRLVWSGGLVELLGGFGFSVGASRVALTRAVARGMLERVRDGRLVSYRPTPRTVRLLEEGDRRIFTLGRQPHSADVWTVLWYAMPEERALERSRLARRLRFLGFGSAQDGLWFSPHDREAEAVSLIAELDVTEHVGLVVGRPAASLGFRTLVARAWDLDALDERYRRFVATYKPHRTSRLGERDAFFLRTRLVHEFRRFPALDPELPDELMPGPRHRAAAVELFHGLYPALGPAAQRHFDGVTRLPGDTAISRRRARG